MRRQATMRLRRPPLEFRWEEKKEIVASAAAAKMIHFDARCQPVRGPEAARDGIKEFARGTTIQGASRNKTSITPSCGHPVHDPAAIPSHTAAPRRTTIGYELPVLRTPRICSPFTRHA